MTRFALVYMLAAAVALSGCRADVTDQQPDQAEERAPETEEPAAPADSDGPDAEIDADEPDDDVAWDGTTSEIRQEQEGDYRSATLAAVRFGPRADEDRAVFEFADAMPGFTVRYVDQPTECGSGHEVEMAGAYYLAVSMSPAAAHEQANGDRRATVEQTERRLRMPRIEAATQTCDHHDGVTWVLGLTERAPFRVLDLEDPYRLVVDVQR